ncbi:hypothetical protein LCGC14_1490260 [marine sediment metagenome]|uniref:Uncharacterized protein n=1 Tax=marine sediment metagenome TaxID=412755 RepID=A0A0F9J6Y7_9ZZZZ
MHILADGYHSISPRWGRVKDYVPAVPEDRDDRAEQNASDE